MDDSLDIAVTVAAAAWRAAHDAIGGVAERAARAVWAVEGGTEPAELSIVLADDAMVRDLNRTHRDKDAATNVLAFPLAGPEGPAAPDGEVTLLGDVVLAFETVAREAERDGKPLDMHVSHLVVHGLLHLLGHDHAEDASAARMEALEVRAMASLGYTDPYAPIAEAAE